MKRLIAYTSFFFLLIHSTAAQDEPVCEPDTAFINSGALIDPAPFINDTLGGGLPDACLNTPYDLTIFVHPPNTFTSGNITVPVDFFRIDSVVNLPQGLEYSCNTENCTFLADSISCIYLSGTPTEENTGENYELTIHLTVSALGFPIPATFPDPTLAPGSYSIALHMEGSEACQTVPTLDFRSTAEWMNLYPNPVQDHIRLDLDGKMAADATLKIWNQSGALMKQVSVKNQGIEEILVGDLPGGFYIATLQSESGLFRAKFIKD